MQRDHRMTRPGGSRGGTNGWDQGALDGWAPGVRGWVIKHSLRGRRIEVEQAGEHGPQMGLS